METRVQEIDSRSVVWVRRWGPMFLFILGILVFLPSIWSESSVTERDEFSLSFRTPMEMQERGAVLTPWLDGEPRFRKPPLLYWAILANYKLFGVSLASARIWGVLAGAGLAVCSCLLARRVSRTNGLLAGMLTLSCLGVAVEARQAMMDLPVAFFSVASVVFWVRWLRNERWKNIIASAVALGLAFLVKGPVGFFFFLAGALTAPWIFGEWSIFKRQRFQLFIWLVIVLAVCLPWPLWMRLLWGDEFLKVVQKEIGARHFIDGHMRPLTAIWGLVGLIFPWTPLFLGAVVAYFKKVPGDLRRRQLWLLAWCAIALLPFLVMKSAERYLLAIVPVQAVWMASWLEQADSAMRRWLTVLSVIGLALVVLTFSAIVFWLNLGVAGPVLCLVATLWTLWHACRGASPMRIAAGAVIVMSLCVGAIYPRLGVDAMPSDVQQKIGSLPVAHFGTTQPSMLSMRLGYSVQTYDEKSFPDELTDHRKGMAVFFSERQRAAFETMVTQQHLQAEELFHYGTLAAVKTFFEDRRSNQAARREAMRTRSIEPLQMTIYCYRVMLPQVTAE